MAREEPEFDLKRVVCVDDDACMLRTHSRVLRAHGFRPVEIADPALGLADVRETIPGVLVVDLSMPGMTGLELVTRLRTELGRECPPVILVSAHLEDLAPMEQIMFDSLFTKPYGVDAFIECVQRLARSHYERRRASSGVARKRGGKPDDRDGST